MGVGVVCRPRSATLGVRSQHCRPSPAFTPRPPAASVPPGEIKLEMPSISVEGDVATLAGDPDTLEALEQCVINWLNQISEAVEGQLKKTPQVSGVGFHEPLAGLGVPPSCESGARPVVLGGTADSVSASSSRADPDGLNNRVHC